jgi:hypothetical protein
MESTNIADNIGKDMQNQTKSIEAIHGKQSQTSMRSGAKINPIMPTSRAG